MIPLALLSQCICKSRIRHYNSFSFILYPSKGFSSLSSLGINSGCSSLMKLLLSISVSIAAIGIAIYQQEIISEFMRGIVPRNTTINNLTKNLNLRTQFFGRTSDSLIKDSNLTSNNISTMGNNTKFVGLPVIPPNDPSLHAKDPKPRTIRMVFEAKEQAEGAGATVRRSIGTPKLRNLSPFLMLDAFTISVGGE